MVIFRHAAAATPDAPVRHVVTRLTDGALLAAIADGSASPDGPDGAGAPPLLAAAVEARLPDLAALSRPARAAAIGLAALQAAADDGREGVLARAIELADESLRAPAAQGALDCGQCAITGLHVRDGVATWSHVGHARLYRLRDGALSLLTTDHTAEWQMFKQDESGPTFPRVQGHVLTRAAGGAIATADTAMAPALRGDVYLLASAAAHAALSEEVVRGILAGSGTDVRGAAESLHQTAIACGATAAAGVVVVRVDDPLGARSRLTPPPARA